jgi:hypothetical protein
VFLPVVGAPVLHAPVLRFDLLRALKVPLDGGATVRGRRVFGANKTLRGALLMSAGCVGAAALLSRWHWYRARLPEELRDRPLVLGIALALRPWYRMPARELATSFALVSVVHAGVNVAGYAIGARSTFV